MQTFFTRASLTRSLDDLDDARLGKQRVEGLQIIQTLTGVSDAYKNHPVMFMWRTYESALIIYTMMACVAWQRRGFADSTFWKVARIAEALEKQELFLYERPPWVDDVDFLRSHRSNLIRKVPERYGPLFKGTPKDLPYLWPVVDDEGGYVLKVSKVDKDRLKSGDRTLPDSIANKVANL